MHKDLYHMLYLHIATAEDASGHWQSLDVVPLIAFDDLYGAGSDDDAGSFGLSNYRLVLANGEVMVLGAAFWSANNSISFVIESDDRTLLNVGLFKKQLDTFDPSIVFRTPGDLTLSFMFSSAGHNTVGAAPSRASDQ